jgi:hypothetical protein
MIDINSQWMQIEQRVFQTVSSRLAEEEKKKGKEEEFEKKVPKQYWSFRELVFGKESFDQLPEKRPWDHAIELVPGAKLKDCKIYLLSQTKQMELDKFIEEHLKSGRIRPSKSPSASLFFFVKKKDGSLRPVQDYRRLNEVMIKNKYPLLLIQELIDKLRGKKYFTKLDICWGYNNMRIREGDKWKAAFRMN